jgi:putative colanic acid biosynthesis acetyltransferase WcaF
MRSELEERSAAPAERTCMTLPRRVLLSGFTGEGYNKGRGRVWQVSWMIISGSIFSRWWCPAALRVLILRSFGASIGNGVLVRHRVRIHWPWKLTVGDHSWIGEDAWILNLEPVRIGANVCISQGALLCTGSHDFRSETFEFKNSPIVIEDGVWVAIRATILKGVTIGRNAVVGAQALVTHDVAAEDIVVAAQASRLTERG